MARLSCRKFLLCVVLLVAIFDKCLSSSTWDVAGTFQSIFKQTRPRLQVDVPAQEALLNSPQAQWGLAQQVAPPNPFIQQQIPIPTEDPTSNEVEDVGDPKLTTTTAQPAVTTTTTTTETVVTASSTPGQTTDLPAQNMTNKTPACAGPDATWCLDDPQYPSHEVVKAIRFHRVNFLDLYADIADLSTANSVERLEAPAQETYICDSGVTYARPKRALNAAGQWRMIINDVVLDNDTLSQSVRVEVCSDPRTACTGLSDCYNSSCVQKYAYNRLLVYDPDDTHFPFAVDSFPFPSSCDCVAASFIINDF